MKIGILTYHCSTNYGAVLQAYALRKAIETQGWKDVEIINYQPFSMLKRYFIRPLRPFTKKFQVNTKLFVNLKQCLKIRRFVLNNLKLSRKRLYTKASLKKNYQQYELIICGSDQIWNIDPVAGLKSSAFFLDFIDNQADCQKMSYAASFGDTNSLGKYQEFIVQSLKSFNKILVRDSNSLRLVEKECNLQAAKVLDPTFLTNYDAVAVPPKLKEEYLLIYRQKPFESSQQNFIRAIAKNKGLIIVSVGRASEVADMNFAAVDPGEWVGFFKNAAYIVTNTYHGTIFSIIFKKQFTVIMREDKLNKTGDLLKDFDLEDRTLSAQLSSQSLDPSLVNIDYSKVGPKIQAAIANSKNQLFTAIENRSALGNLS